MRILITSESTRVPPVTALRSPPASRTTGADSPVMADSSTVAAPSMTSPSPGISSPAVDHDDVALAQLVGGDLLDALPSLTMRLAKVWVRVLRSALACALPRPSAMASAKLAKST